MPQTLLHRITSDPGQLLSVSTVTARRPGRVVVQVVGEVDSYTAPALDVCLLSQARQPGIRELVVDQIRVTFLGAAGSRWCRRRTAAAQARRPAGSPYEWPARGALPVAADRVRRPRRR